MNSPRDLRRRIKSIHSTSQITRAMQMVAASKMRKAQDAAVATRPFVRLLYQIQRKITTRPIEVTHPLLETREVRRRAVILVGADKGLCGALNANLFRVAAQFDPATTVFITAGRRASAFVAATGRQLAADFPYGDTPRFEEARAVASFARDLFVKKEVDAVDIVATRFVNTMTQEAVRLEFLPIGAIRSMQIPDMDVEGALAADQSEPVFEPSADAMISFLLGHYVNIFIFVVMLNAKASEQSARMMSMKNATDSADDLLRDLTTLYNTLRQGNITKELLEIAGGQAE